MIRVLFGLEDRIRLGLGDTPLPLDPTRLSVWEAAELEDCGLDVDHLGEAMRTRTARAILAVGWLAARRAGKAGKITAFDFDLGEVTITAEPDPGTGSGKADDASASTATSSP